MNALRVVSLLLLALWIARFVYVPVERSLWNHDLLNDKMVHAQTYDRAESVWLWNYTPVEQAHWWTGKEEYYEKEEQVRMQIDLDLWLPELVVLGLLAGGVSFTAWRKP